MNTNDLKIGDWILVNGIPTKVEEVGIGVGIYMNRNDTPNNEMYYPELDEMKPIPITKEILEKNGWILRRPQVYLMDVEHYSFKIIINEDFSTIYMNTAIGEKICLDGIKWVHQLQHILWALGLNDNFVL